MIYLLRHGLDDENYIGGWSELDLTAEGIKGVNNTIEKIKEKNINITRIISSDIKRAKTTANMVASSLNISDIKVDPNLNEQNKGLLNGMIKTKAKEEYPDFVSKNVTVDTVYPEGESMRNMYDRIRKYLNTIYTFEDNTLIVTHRGVINMIYYILNNVELDMDKEKFDVVHSSLHELDKERKEIRRII